MHVDFGIPNINQLLQFLKKLSYNASEHLYFQLHCCTIEFSNMAFCSETASFVGQTNSTNLNIFVLSKAHVDLLLLSLGILGCPTFGFVDIAEHFMYGPTPVVSVSHINSSNYSPSESNPTASHISSKAIRLDLPLSLSMKVSIFYGRKRRLCAALSLKQHFTVCWTNLLVI